MWVTCLLRGRETRGNVGLERLLFCFAFVDRGESGFGVNAHENVPVTRVPSCHYPAEISAGHQTYRSQHGIGGSL